MEMIILASKGHINSFICELFKEHLFKRGNILL